MEPEPQETPSGRRITQADVRWILGGTLAVLFGVFIGQNSTEVNIHFVFFSTKFRLIWIFLICAVLGAIIDRLLQRRGLLPATRRKRKEERQKAKGQ